MREGALLILGSRLNQVNLNYIQKKLNECCDKYGGRCDRCPDEQLCVLGYDMRCGLGEVKCSMCKELVPLNDYCSECGALLKKSELSGIRIWSRG